MLLLAGPSSGLSNSVRLGARPDRSKRQIPSKEFQQRKSALCIGGSWFCVGAERHPNTIGVGHDKGVPVLKLGSNELV